MARQHKKHEWSPYMSDVQRFSIYPRIQVPRDENEQLRVGSVITVSINNVTDRGLGIAEYNGRKVYVYNASLGSRVKARIVKVMGDVAYAEILEVLSEVDENFR